MVYQLWCIVTIISILWTSVAYNAMARLSIFHFLVLAPHIAKYAWQPTNSRACVLANVFTQNVSLLCIVFMFCCYWHTKYLFALYCFDVPLLLPHKMCFLCIVLMFCCYCRKITAIANDFLHVSFGWAQVFMLSHPSVEECYYDKAFAALHCAKFVGA